MTRKREGLKILIAEDEVLAAMELESLVMELGHDVSAVVPQPERIVPAAERCSPDIALLDVNLRGGRSYAAAQILAARGIAIIFVTGYGALADMPEDLSDAPRLEKPFVRSQLKAALTRASPGSG